MARLRLIHWNGPEGRERKLRLAALGHHVEFDELDTPDKLRLLRRDLPDAYLIDLTRMPSSGRQVGMSLRTYKDTRSIPLIFVDGDPQKVAQLKALLPDATYTTWPRLKTAIPRAIAKPIAAPVVPPSSIYTGKPTVEKLGIKASMKVGLIGAPKGFANSLGALPEGATFSAKPDASCDLFVCVVRSRQALATQLAGLARLIARQTVWIIWAKQASGVASDLNGNVVRETGLASGWVDFKICSVDDTWSGLAFKRRTA